MYSDIVGEDLGDDLVGDELLGDELLGDDLMGDELVGADDIVGNIDENTIADYLVGDYDSAGDEFSGDEFSGDEFSGDVDLVGAARKRRRRRRRVPRQARARALLRRAMLAKRLKAAKVLHRRKPTKGRIQSIGFTRAAVPPGSTVEITARPQTIFRGTRLLVGSSIAEAFVIEDIKVGRNSQFVATGAQPAEAFRDTATGDNVSLDTCRPGVDLTLIVTNTTGTAVDFRASLFGDVVE
jgi:hypothetical protein